MEKEIALVVLEDRAWYSMISPVLIKPLQHSSDSEEFGTQKAPEDMTRYYRPFCSCLTVIN